MSSILPENCPGDNADGLATTVLPDGNQVQEMLARLQSQPLADNHLDDLHASGLTDETIRAAGICSATAEDSVALGFHASAAIVFPHAHVPGYVRIKPDQPRVDRNGRRIKYETSRGGVPHIYFPPRTHRQLFAAMPYEGTDAAIITEGEKKALKADEEGYLVMSTPGVSAWQKASAELERIGWRGRVVYVVFDSDVVRKTEVKEAVSALAWHLGQLGAVVRVVRLPDLEGFEKTGLDDFLATQGRPALDELLQVSTDWFQTLLAMLQSDLDPTQLEEMVAPVLRYAQRSGVCGVAAFASQLKQRLAALGYAAPSVEELKRAIRIAKPFQAEWQQNQENETQDLQSETFVAEGQEGNYPDAPERWGLYSIRGQDSVQLSNFVVYLDRDMYIEEGADSRRLFQGRIEIGLQSFPFEIDSRDFANNDKLKAAIFSAAGAIAQILCRVDTLRTAISAVSSPESHMIRTAFGWNAGKTEYLVPSGTIDAAGFHVTPDDGVPRLDLSGSDFAKHLDMHALDPCCLQDTKRHIVDDLLQLCPEKGVGRAMLGAVALAVLFPYTTGMNRVGFWINGLSGSGKSFLARLFQCFFGRFYDIGQAGVMNWISTPKRIQHEGYYCKDAAFLVDDYKPEHCSPHDACWILQGYADAAARGRLNRDATAATSKEIRGQLICTGEDVPDHSASATARMIVLPYPNGPKDIERGRRCLNYASEYPGVMADFIRHILANGRASVFVERVGALQAHYYGRITGRDNDVRVAGNFALLAAAFEEFALFLSDDWPDVNNAITEFVHQYLPSLMDNVLAEVAEQKASSVFLQTLAVLLRQRRVRIEGWCDSRYPPNTTVVGRLVPGQFAYGSNVAVEIWTRAALTECNRTLKTADRPTIRATETNLLREMCEEGLLLGPNNEALTSDVSAVLTRQVRVGNANRHAFRIWTRNIPVDAETQGGG